MSAIYPENIPPEAKNTTQWDCYKLEVVDGTTISTTGRKGTEWRKFGKDGEMAKARREPRLLSKCTRG